MSPTIDRVHFYERQYLRSYDLTAEQLYHIEMRRRLNLALHLWGIVEGLDLRPSETVPGLAPQFFISRGMAIDAFGREIVVPIDYPITEADLERNRIQIENPELYLSLVYRRELTTPPAAGYRLCDVTDQFTRWREHFAVMITTYDPRVNLGAPPAASDALSDDPDKRPWPVVVGTVSTGRPPESGGKLIVTGAKAVHRTYAGLRAQRIVTPASSVASDTGQAKFPLAIEADLLGRKNVYVGLDFDIKNGDATKPPPEDPTRTTPQGTGVLKVQDDLFLNGEFYANVAGNWLTLKDYFQSFIPDVKVGTLKVPVSPAGLPVADATGALVREFTIPLATTLPKVGNQPKNPNMMVAITGVEGLNLTNLGSWIGSIGSMAPGDPFQIEVRFKNATLVSGQNWNFNLEWEIGPRASLNGGMLPVQSITVSYVAVFTP